MFTEHRGHLLGVAYRLTGSRTDAEDAVQDAWLRWDRIGTDARDAVHDERAWLTTAVTRVCLDRVRSAPARRERYVGPWLPEPLLSPADADDPLERVVRDEDVRLAAVLVLDRLTPDQRVALVLHDAAGLDFAAVAGILDCPVPTARQHAARARRIVAAARADGTLPPRSSPGIQRGVLDAFVTALAAGDVAALAALLHPDVELRSDGGGVVPAARQVVRGPSKVSRLLVAVVSGTGGVLERARPVLVNGSPGLWVPTEPHPAVATLEVLDGRARHVHLVLTPEKLPG